MSGRTLLVTACGLGLLRPAPGTWGSLPPVAMCIALLALGFPGVLINGGLLALCIVACAACIEFGAWAEAKWGRKDARQIVADEVAGQSLALLALPWREGLARDDWQWNIALVTSAFLLFRAADIIKPPPARQLQSIPGGLGVLIDDLVAGAYALIATQLFARFALEPALALLGIEV